MELNNFITTINLKIIDLELLNVAQCEIFSLMFK